MGARSTQSTRVYKREHTVTRNDPLLRSARHQAAFNLLREELPVQVSADEDDLRHAPFALLPLGLGRAEVDLLVDPLKDELLVALPRKTQHTLAPI